jgi:hypothetical protein
MYYNMIPQTSNGRVNILTPDITNLFAMYDKIPANQCVTFRDATLGQWEETLLSKAFFSKENIQILQNGIRAGVYNMSNGQLTIGPQDCDSLKIIMRSMFLSHATNQCNNVVEQIESLNKMVLDYCIPRVFSEAQGYMKYLFDVSTLAVPLDTPKMESQRDKTNYKMPSWF